ncbi:MAG: hypothetical protein WBQ24_04880 [Xanthobacteraceae bacterium]
MIDVSFQLREVTMNVAVRGIASVRNGSGARTTFGGRSFYGSLLALSVSALLLCGNGAALAGPCTTRIIQVERQIADTPDWMFGPILPQSLDAQLHRQPTLETVMQALHARNIDGNAVIDLARKADKDGNIKECVRALVEARRLFELGD